MAAACTALAIALFTPLSALGMETFTRTGYTVEFGSGDATRANAVPDVLAAVRLQLADELGLSAPKRVIVRVLRGSRDFSRVVNGETVELYAGVAYPSSGAIHINADALDRAGTSTAFARTLRHEFVHLALGHTLGRASRPKWFEEGLACAFGSPLPAHELSRVGSGRGFALKALSRFPAEQHAMSLAYAQSESVIRFLISQKSSVAIRELLALLRSGSEFESALSDATGFDIETLDRQWREAFRTPWPVRLLWTVFAPGRPILWTALVMIVGYFFVKRRRRRAAENMDDTF